MCCVFGLEVKSGLNWVSKAVIYASVFDIDFSICAAPDKKLQLVLFAGERICLNYRKVYFGFDGDIVWFLKFKGRNA